MPAAKEQIRQIITENDISSVAGVYTLLKDSFKDILLELIEAELDATLGYQKNQKRDIHIELSAGMASKITDKILPQVKKWQTRPLYHVRFIKIFSNVFLQDKNRRYGVTHTRRQCYIK